MGPYWTEDAFYYLWAGVKQAINLPLIWKKGSAADVTAKDKHHYLLRYSKAVYMSYAIGVMQCTPAWDRPAHADAPFPKIRIDLVMGTVLHTVKQVNNLPSVLDILLAQELECTRTGKRARED